jgi:hypothetical protein
LPSLDTGTAEKVAVIDISADTNTAGKTKANTKTNIKKNTVINIAESSPNDWTYRAFDINNILNENYKIPSSENPEKQ